MLRGLKRMKKSGKSCYQISVELAEKFGKSVESVRDRLKRYISKLNPKDQEMLLQYDQ